MILDEGNQSEIDLMRYSNVVRYPTGAKVDLRNRTRR